MTDPGITELRALAEKATPGSWLHPECDDYSDRDDETLIVQWENYQSFSYVSIPNNEADAQYIAAASPDVILALCDRLTEAELAAIPCAERGVCDNPEVLEIVECHDSTKARLTEAEAILNDLAGMDPINDDEHCFYCSVRWDQGVDHYDTCIFERAREWKGKQP